jgi:predicted Fe-Mo cluster-binding NifX family protein
MIVMPVKMNKPETALSPVFGHSKWFAFVDSEGNVSIEKNRAQGQGGPAVAKFLLEKGVHTVLTSHVGAKPFMLFHNAGIQLYFSGEERITIAEALKGHEAGAFLEITPQTIDQYAHHHGHDHHH